MQVHLAESCSWPNQLCRSCHLYLPSGDEVLLSGHRNGKDVHSVLLFVLEGTVAWDFLFWDFIMEYWGFWHHRQEYSPLYPRQCNEHTRKPFYSVDVLNPKENGPWATPVQDGHWNFVSLPGAGTSNQIKIYLLSDQHTIYMIVGFTVEYYKFQ